MRGGSYAYKLTVSYATHEGQRTARRRSPRGSAAASAVPASPGTRTIKSGHGLPPTCARRLVNKPTLSVRSTKPSICFVDQ